MTIAFTERGVFGSFHMEIRPYRCTGDPFIREPPIWPPGEAPLFALTHAALRSLPALPATSPHVCRVRGWRREPCHKFTSWLTRPRETPMITAESDTE